MAVFPVHRRTRMGGRDPHEDHRAATPLELLFDLTFVVAFGTAANELAHYLAEGHLATGLIGYAFATFGISWAWINFTWFASAYDTDDWVFRLATMVQMLGVLVFALGLPVMFASVDEGRTVDNSVLVAGYVVMRAAMVFLWLRAARQDKERRRACLTYATTILVAQAGWIALLVAQTSVQVMFLWAGLLILLELAGPLDAELRKGGTPWHAHHIAERHGLLVIIALGEGLLGTTVALAAIVEGPGWSSDVVLLGLAGVALGVVATVLTVAIPVSVYMLSSYALSFALTRTADPFHLLLIAGSATVVAASVVMAVAGAPLVWCLVVLALTPWVSVVGYETVGHRHGDRVLADR